MKRMGTLAVLVTALVLSSQAGSTAGNGLYGVVTKGPIRPVCEVGQPCDAPARVTLVFSHLASGREVARTRTALDGRYRQALPPGYYSVRAVERIGIGRNFSPRRVHVRAGHWDRLAFHIDTGIRSAAFRRRG